jgi:hypothetical protein
MPETAVGDIDKALCDLLALGARDSREVQAAMTAAGFSPKRIRSARERIGVVISRSGHGASMRSTWALASHSDDQRGLKTLLINADASSPDALRRTKASDRFGERQGRDGVALNPGEERRVSSRILRFTARGVELALAQELAMGLVLCRDRIGSRDVSCAECQNFTVIRGCSVAAFSGGARDVSEHWYCPYSRSD